MNARLVMASMVLLVGGFCLGQDNQEKKDDKDRLQGEWVATSFNGNEIKGGNGGTLVVKRDEWKEFRTFKFKIDATKNPKQIDITGNVVVGRESTFAGIYKIEGDTLTFCRSSRAGAERPTEFKFGPGVILQVFKRAEKK